MSVTLDDMIEWQLERADVGIIEKNDLGKFVRQFKGAPNEASNILDCTTTKVTNIDNSYDTVFGIDGLSPKVIPELMVVVEPDFLQKSLNFISVNLANEALFECGKDSVSQAYKITSGKMVLQTSTPLVADSTGHAIYVLNQYRDVSDLVSNSGYKWFYSGPNSEKLSSLARRGLSENCALSPQEINILAFIGEGFSSKEISCRLFITKNTVDTHRRNILKKLGVLNTIQAYRKAVELGLLN